MPLTPIKVAHIQAKMAAIVMGRQQSIVLMLKNGDGSTTSLTVPAVWKPDHDADPTLAEIGPHAASASDDVVSIFLLSDVSLQQMRAVIYAYPLVSTGAEPANRYLLMSVTPKGMLPGGDRLICKWTRQR